MRREWNSHRYFCLFALFALTSAPAWPQTVELSKSTGAPGTIYHGSDIDDVNLSSGNLRITIPLLSLPGRGLNTDIVLTYNSKIWKTVKVFDPTGYAHYVASVDGDTNRNPSYGWGLGVPRMGRQGNAWSICVGRGGDGISCVAAYFYQDWVTNDGTRTTLVNTGGPWGGGPPITDYWSFDGSYIRADRSHSTFLYKDGVSAVEAVYPSFVATLKDTNGNFLTCSPASCTDTLGRLINFNSVSGSLQTITYNDSSGAAQTFAFTYRPYTLYYPWVTDALDGDCSGWDQCGVSQRYSTSLLSKVTLPNNLSYEFEYVLNADGTTTGEINKLTLPTGGYIRYTYGWVTTLPGDFDPWYGHRRAVATRVVSSDGTTGAEKTWTYSIQDAACWFSTPNAVSTVTDPLGNVQAYTKAPGKPIPTKMEFKDPAGRVLKTTLQDVGFDTSSFNDPFGDNSCPIDKPSNPRVTGRTTVFNDTNQQSREEFIYGTHGNVTEKKEYDLQVGAPGTLIRRTRFSYLQNENPTYAAPSVNILNRVTSQIVLDAAGATQAQTTASYDSPGLTATSSVVQHDYTSHPATYTLRGNATQISRWRNWTGTWLTTTNSYNDVGNLLQTTDPGGHTTSFSYADNFYNFTPSQPASAYVTRVTLPPTGGVSHIRKKQHYFYSGLVAASCGENFPSPTCAYAPTVGQADFTTFTYDLMNRPVTTTHGDGSQTTLTYNETLLPITTSSTTRIDATRNLVLTSVYDGLGRASQTQLSSDPQGTTYTKTEYDALGRKSKVFNPTRCFPIEFNCGESTAGFTSSEYDALGRVTKVIPPDGTATANNVSIIYVGNTTTVTDQAGKKRKSETDALGRLTKVWEPDAGGAFVYETAYQYDVLDNLTRVDQKGNDPNSANWRTRTFVYDSLSQLTRASNPESGTINYPLYDDDGNLIFKTDARVITTTHSYDALHRLTGKTYSNGDPAITYFYDQTTYNGLTVTNGVGRRTGMSDAAGAEAWSFDTMGRVVTERRSTNGVTKDTSYTYNLDGSVATLTSPSGRMLTYSYNAAARPLSAVDTANSINYARAASYAPQGALASLVFGQTATFPGINLNQGYNSRLQPTTIRAWSTNATTPVALDLSYCFNGNIDLTVTPNNCARTPVQNNGNVAQIGNNRSPDRTQNLTYDELNRISTARTQATSGSNCWGETFGYDIWANLLSIGAVTGYTGCTQENLSVSVTAKNQISGFTYDAAGNLTATPAPGAASYAYNAENQLTSTAGVSYTYDGDGKRVQKSSGKLYWYGMGNDALDESDAAGNITDEYIFFGGKRIARWKAATNEINYYLADHLGSSRVMTNATGQVLDDSDFYPFGGERPVVSASGNTYKFTGKERDSESGLDNFGARYFGSSMGRFMSPDSPSYSNWKNPQSWNLYAYALNNPVSFKDDDGHEIVTDGTRCDLNTDDCKHDEDASDDSKNRKTMKNRERMTQNTWSLSWQISASASFLGQELQGVADTTIAPVVNAVEHPIDTLEGIANAVVHPVETAERIVNGAVDTAKDAASGDPRAIGQVAGTVIATAAGVKGAQAAAEEAQGLRGVVNRVARGPREGEIQHVGIVNNKGNLIHIGREGTDWHIGLGRGGRASGAGATVHIPLPKWLSNLFNP